MGKRKHDCGNCHRYVCYGECKKRGGGLKIVSPIKKMRVEKSPIVKNLAELVDLAKDDDVVFTNINSAMLKNVAPQLRALVDLVGMGELKESIFYQVLYYLQNMHLVSGVGKNDFMHTCLMGSPGVGKTTVAKIIAEMYKSAGVLSKSGVFKIATRSDLIGGYLGQTAMKTKGVLDSCIGGVLFIDEVYSLGSGEDRGTDSFSKECIDTINGFMSEHKHDFCLIVAGYESEIDKCFFSVNAGLPSRFPWRYTLRSYSADELAEIALKMVAEIKWKTDVKKEELGAVIKKHHKEVFTSEARSVENWIAKVKLAHSKRVFALEFSCKFVLSVLDFEMGVELMKKNMSLVEVKAPMEMYM